MDDGLTGVGLRVPSGLIARPGLSAPAFNTVNASSATSITVTQRKSEYYNSRSAGRRELIYLRQAAVQRGSLSSARFLSSLQRRKPTRYASCYPPSASGARGSVFPVCHPIQKLMALNRMAMQEKLILLARLLVQGNNNQLKRNNTKVKQCFLLLDTMGIPPEEPKVHDPVGFEGWKLAASSFRKPFRSATRYVPAGPDFAAASYAASILCFSVSAAFCRSRIVSSTKSRELPLVSRPLSEMEEQREKVSESNDWLFFAPRSMFTFMTFGAPAGDDFAIWSYISSVFFLWSMASACLFWIDSSRELANFSDLVSLSANEQEQVTFWTVTYCLSYIPRAACFTACRRALTALRSSTLSSSSSSSCGYRDPLQSALLYPDQLAMYSPAAPRARRYRP